MALCVVRDVGTPRSCSCGGSTSSPMPVYICKPGRVLLCVGAGRRSRSACLLSITLFTRCSPSRPQPKTAGLHSLTTAGVQERVATSYKTSCLLGNSTKATYSYLLTWFNLPFTLFYPEEVRFHSHSRTSRQYMYMSCVY